MKPPARNQLIADKQGTVSRVLEIYPSLNWAVVFPVHAPKALPKKLSWLTLIEEAAKGEWRDAEIMSDALAKIAPSASAIKIRDRRWAIISELVNVPGKQNHALFERKGRGAFIETHAQKIHASPETVLATLRLFWQGGQNTDALLPSFVNCGRRLDGEPKVSQNRDNASRSRGRTPTQHDYKAPYVFSLKEEKTVVMRALKILKEGR